MCGEAALPITWNALFWIILLFNAVNAIAKVFFKRTRVSISTWPLWFPSSHYPFQNLYNALLMLFLSGLILYFTVWSWESIQSRISGALIFALGTAIIGLAINAETSVNAPEKPMR